MHEKDEAQREARPFIHSVSGLQRQLRRELEGAHARVYVGGEISNLTKNPVSGHAYFTLKDDYAQLKCVLWRDQAARIRFELKDGMEAIVRGKVTVFERGGQLQLSVDAMKPQGAGVHLEAFRRLAEKLRAEGATSPERKRPIPLLSDTIGIVTSKEGAALRDILRTVKRRHPEQHLILCPTPVQGMGAATEIAACIRRLDRLQAADVIIVARGGGSVEDLAAFNQESVARAILGCSTPVVCGIGHETDTTIADLVADLSASTPTAAAEHAVPVVNALVERLSGCDARLRRALTRKLTLDRARLDALSHKLRSPQMRLKDEAQRLDDLTSRAERLLTGKLASDRATFQSLSSRLERIELRTRVVSEMGRIAALESRAMGRVQMMWHESSSRLRLATSSLEALSPLKVLARGYSITRSEDGQLVRSSAQVQPGDSIEVQLAKGRIGARVERASTGD